MTQTKDPIVQSQNSLAICFPSWEEERLGEFGAALRRGMVSFGGEGFRQLCFTRPFVCPRNLSEAWLGQFALQPGTRLPWGEKPMRDMTPEEQLESLRSHLGVDHQAQQAEVLGFFGPTGCWLLEMVVHLSTVPKGIAWVPARHQLHIW